MEVPGGFAADVFDVEFDVPYQSLDSASLQLAKPTPRHVYN